MKVLWPTWNRLLPILLFTLFVSSCNGVLTQPNSLKPVRDSSVSDGISVVDVSSSVEKLTASSWNVRVFSTKTNEEIDSVYFQDAQNIYGLAFKSFVKFFDKNGTWRKVASNTQVGINDLVFSSGTNAFVAGYRVSRESPSAFIAEILKSENAGELWQTVYSISPALFERIAVNSSGKVCVVGRKKAPENFKESLNLIVCSDDGGKNWNDLSEHLNEAARDENGRIGDFLKDILFTSNNEITVLSIRGKIYRSNDNGNSWRLSSYLPDEPEQTCICDLGELADERLFVSGGAVATEGIWGMLAVQQDDKTWKRFRLPGFYFSEVEFLSLNEVIAVGSVVEGLDVDIDNGGRGVVLHSTDGGETWTIVYKSSASSELTSIYVISELNILVGGKSGEIIKLHK